MTRNYPVQHIDAYVALPELAIPVVAEEISPGRICRVLAVDFYIALKSDCRDRGIEAFDIPGIFRCGLPAVVLEEQGRPACYRLPNSLAEWIYELLRDRRHEKQFPADIAFGIRRDEHYAAFVKAAV